jgi:hypothetical protein
VKHLPEQKVLNELAQLKNEYDDLCEPEQFGVVVRIEHKGPQTQLGGNTCQSSEKKDISVGDIFLLLLLCNCIIKYNINCQKKFLTDLLYLL